jgi:hypothetical protein
MTRVGFGLSVQSENALVLQPAVGRAPGVLFLVSEDQTYRLDLNDAVVTPHRTELNVPSTTSNQTATSGAMNYAFVNETMKTAIDSNSYSVADNCVFFKYMIDGVQYSATLKAFKKTPMVDVMRVMTKEMHKQYDSVNDLIQTAREKGIELESESTVNDFDIAEQMKKKQMTAKYFSSVRPGVRSASTKKGFK